MTSEGRTPNRRRTTASDIQSTVARPGDVQINVKGAFIVDDGPGTPRSSSSTDYEHDPRDIRLPNHTSVVSHVAVDVCTLLAASHPA